MKPRNFEGRKKLRREKAAYRRGEGPYPEDWPYVTDIRIRIGGAGRRSGEGRIQNKHKTGPSQHGLK